MNCHYALSSNIIIFNLKNLTMIAFFIFYGLIEIANAIYLYGKTKQSQPYLIVIVSWGFMFVLVGLVELFGITGAFRNMVYIFFGASWFPMMFTPCSVKIFRINNFTLLIRRIIFAIIGLSQLFLITW